MKATDFLALRYLKSSRENRFFSWITVLSTLGITIGVAALIVVISVINGFEFELRKRFLHANAHIMAYRYPAGMANPEKWSASIRKDFPRDVSGVSPFVHLETMAKNQSIMHGILVRGVNPELRESIQSLKEVITPYKALEILQKEIDEAPQSEYERQQSEEKTPSVIVGSGLLGILNAKVGDLIQLVSPTNEKLTELKSFRVIGTYNSGLKHYDNRLVIMSLYAAQRFVSMGSTVTGLEIGIHDASESVRVTRQMKEKYNLTFREWQSFNRPLFEAMEKERMVIVMIVAMVVFVASFNILTTIFISVTQKQRDISILKALGARNRQIVEIFLKQGLYVGILGAIFGSILAFAVSQVLQRYQFLDLPDPYFLRHLPVHYSPWVYLTVGMSAVVICIVAGFYPARVAAQVQPTEGFSGTGKAF